MRLKFLLIAAATALAGAALLAASPAGDVSPRAAKLHASAIVLDTHVDTTQRLLFENFDLATRDTKGHVDIPRMREGGLDGAFFSIYIPGTVTGPEAVKRAIRLIDAIYEQVRRHPRDLMLATSASQVRAAHRQGKIAVLLGMEGGHIIDDDLGVLRMYAALGVRYLTLTHGRNTNWADSSTDTPAHNGLTDLGREVVRELNRQGVMVDISHVSDKTFYDVVETSRAPIIASHSSCRSLCDVPRNVTDDMIRALTKKGGVVQINYAAGFLSQERADASRSLRTERRARFAEIVKQCGADEACKVEAEDRLNKEFAARLPKVTWEKIVDHIDHVAKLVGVDYVGLGSDFDGATMPEGMEDCSKLPRITEGLLRKGYSEKDIRKILGGNVLRVMEQVEKVSREMQAEEGKPAGGQTKK